MHTWSYPCHIRLVLIYWILVLVLCRLDDEHARASGAYLGLAYVNGGHLTKSLVWFKCNVNNERI